MVIVSLLTGTYINIIWRWNQIVHFYPYFWLQYLFPILIKKTPWKNWSSGISFFNKHIYSQQCSIHLFPTHYKSHSWCSLGDSRSRLIRERSASAFCSLHILFCIGSLSLNSMQSEFACYKNEFKHFLPPIMISLAPTTPTVPTLIPKWGQNTTKERQDLHIPQYFFFYPSFLVFRERK